MKESKKGSRKKLNRHDENVITQQTSMKTFIVVNYDFFSVSTLV